MLHACLSCLKLTRIWLTSWVKCLGDIVKTKDNKTHSSQIKHTAGSSGKKWNTTGELSLADFSWCPRIASGMTALSSVFCLSSKMPFSQSCSAFKLSHINLRTTEKSTSSSNWHMWFENNAQNKCTHKKWKKRWTWDIDGWFSSITAK